MKSKFSYTFAHILQLLRVHIGLWLIGIITIALMPINILHHHEEDAHYVHALQSNTHLEHTCSLDTYVCQQGLTGTCDHTHHLQTEQASCFACEFVFTTYYSIGLFEFIPSQTVSRAIFSNYACHPYTSLLLKICTRGPPQV